MGGKLADMRPGYDDLWVGGITEFAIQKKVKIDNAAVPPVNRVVSVLFTYKIRYHTSSTARRIWCPRQDIINGVGGCTGGGGYADIERAVRVVLQNNDLGRRNQLLPAWTEERALGYLHFFKPVLPDVWEN